MQPRHHMGMLVLLKLLVCVFLHGTVSGAQQAQKHTEVISRLGCSIIGKKDVGEVRHEPIVRSAAGVGTGTEEMVSELLQLPGFLVL